MWTWGNRSVAVVVAVVGLQEEEEVVSTLLYQQKATFVALFAKVIETVGQQQTTIREGAAEGQLERIQQ